ncbi:hypothetical protein QKW55_01950 [Bacillus paralicheniformis]|nr:hypothetical protein [Bacillus paralicheniformis]UAL14285.1 hypothetical protein KY997_20780 [Bacillus paralicheniformis]WEZ22786.1 hypothetical protein P5637_15190 [Bacillus paralicheniformis]WHH55159.1 hypothetical protein QKW55_01950 [Bacillus paralicheniformis]
MKKIFVSLALAFVLSFSFYSSSKAAVLARVAVYPGEVRQSADIFHGVGGVISGADFIMQHV